MAKMFEHKRWIRYVPGEGFKGKMIDINLIRREFPIDRWLADEIADEARGLGENEPASQ
jgi:hypothetical protein